MRLGRRRREQQYGDPNAVASGVNALTASGVRIGKEEGEELRRLNQEWQARAYGYFDLLGEIKYASGFFSRGLAKLELFAAERDEDGEIVPTTNQDAIDALARVKGTTGGRSQILSNFAKLVFLVGECQLFYSKRGAVEEWEVLSTDELRPNPAGGGYQRWRAPGLTPEQYKEPPEDQWETVDADEAIAFRLWQPHPRWSHLADSTMRGVLDDCEELAALKRAVRARIRSRLAGAGILFIDDRISKAPEEPAPDEDPMEDVFVSRIVAAMTAPMVDQGAASAVAPLVVRVSVPEPDGSGSRVTVKDMVSHLRLVEPSEMYPEVGMMLELRKRIAIGLEMPPESLLGVGDTNHWNAWEISDQEWTHLEPMARLLVESMTGAYYQPTLKDANVADAERYLIWYDESKVVVRPDRGPAAESAHDAGVLSDEALRTHLGFDEDDAPSEEERLWWLAVKTRDAGLALTGEPTAPAPPPPLPGQEPPVDPNGDPEAGDGAEVPAETKRQPPPRPDAGEASRVLGAADVALRRSRQAAGNKLRNLAKRDPATLARLEGVASSEIAATLGRDAVRDLGAPATAALVAGARDLIEETLAGWSLSPATVASIVDHLEQHAARTLYDHRPPPLPPSFTNWLYGVLDTNGTP